MSSRFGSYVAGLGLMQATKKLADAKQQGNDAFKAAKYKVAVEKYQEALEIDSQNIVCSKLYCNQGLAQHKLKNYGDAVKAFDSALEIDEQYTKAYSKRALAYIELEQYQDAIADCEKACDMNPGDRELRQAVEHAKLELKKSKRKNYYKILGVEKGESDERAIKKAYRKKAMVYHPGALQQRENERVVGQRWARWLQEALFGLSFLVVLDSIFGIGARSRSKHFGFDLCWHSQIAFREKRPRWRPTSSSSSLARHTRC